MNRSCLDRTAAPRHGDGYVQKMYKRVYSGTQPCGCVKHNGPEVLGLDDMHMMYPVALPPAEAPFGPE